MIWGTPIYGNLHIVLVLIPCQGEYSQTEQKLQSHPPKTQRSGPQKSAGAATASHS